MHNDDGKGIKVKRNTISVHSGLCPHRKLKIYVKGVQLYLLSLAKKRETSNQPGKEVMLSEKAPFGAQISSTSTLNVRFVIALPFQNSQKFKEEFTDESHFF